MTASFNPPNQFDGPSERWAEFDRASHGAQPSRPALGDEIRQVTRIFRDRWLLVLGTMVAVVVAMLAFIWNTTPLYQAEVELLIDPRQKQTLEREVAPTGLGSSAVGADTLLLDSQIEVIWSNSTMQQLVREEGLLDDPEFVGAQSSPLIEQIKDFIKGVAFGPHEATWKKTSPYDRALETLSDRLSVERARNTYVISLKMLSADPQKAAAIVTRLADIYIQQTNSAASSSTRDTAENLDARLDQLRLAAQAAAERVEAYKREKNLIGAQEVLVVEQQLRELNAQLGQAQVETQTTKALLNQVRAAGKVEGGRAVTSVVQSPVLSELQLRLAEIDAEEADLEMTLLPRHPAFKRLQEKRAAALASIQAEYRRILNRLEVSYDSAVEKEAALQAQVNDLEGRMASSNADSVMLRQLEREADASRGVYETYLTRSKQVREQIDLPTSTARIISAAAPASRPAYPQVPLLLGAALAAGLLLGLALAWLSYVLGHGEPHERRKQRRGEPTRQAAQPAWQPPHPAWQPSHFPEPLPAQFAQAQPAQFAEPQPAQVGAAQPVHAAPQPTQAVVAPVQAYAVPVQPAPEAAELSQPARASIPPSEIPLPAGRSHHPTQADQQAPESPTLAAPQPAEATAPATQASTATTQPAPELAQSSHATPPSIRQAAAPLPVQPAHEPAEAPAEPTQAAPEPAQAAPEPAPPAAESTRQVAEPTEPADPPAVAAPPAHSPEQSASAPAVSSRQHARYIGPYAVSARPPAPPAPRTPQAAFYSAPPAPQPGRSLLSFARQPRA